MLDGRHMEPRRLQSLPPVPGTSSGSSTSSSSQIASSPERCCQILRSAQYWPWYYSISSTFWKIKVCTFPWRGKWWRRSWQGGSREERSIQGQERRDYRWCRRCQNQWTVLYTGKTPVLGASSCWTWMPEDWHREVTQPMRKEPSTWRQRNARQKSLCMSYLALRLCLPVCRPVRGRSTTRILVQTNISW